MCPLRSPRAGEIVQRNRSPGGDQSQAPPHRQFLSAGEGPLQSDLLPFVAILVVRIYPAESREAQAAALAIYYGRLPPPDRDRQVQHSLEAAAGGEFPLDHLLIAEIDNSIRGVLLAVRRPGGAAFVWPPVLAAGETSASIAIQLLTAAGERFDDQGVLFGQALIDTADVATSATFAQGGFPKLTELILLSRPEDRRSSHPDMAASAPKPWDCLPYSRAAHARFARVIEETCRETLDCPKLAQRRSGDQLLESHFSSGIFHPEFCLLYHSDDQDVGVILIAEYPERNAWEVSYLGVIPSARQQGWGRTILQDGIARANRWKNRGIDIAVDVANTPALRLYASLGFRESCQYAVHLRLAPEHTPPRPDSPVR
jgi:mycothiol synthase